MGGRPRWPRLRFVPRQRRIGGDAGGDFIGICPVHAAGAFGDGGALRGFVGLRRERAGDKAIYAEVLARGGFAGLGGDAVRDVNLDFHGEGIMAARSCGGKNSFTAMQGQRPGRQASPG